MNLKIFIIGGQIFMRVTGTGKETFSALFCRSQMYGKKFLQQQKKEVAGIALSYALSDSQIINRNVWW